MGRVRSTNVKEHMLLVGKPERKRLLGRTRQRWILERADGRVWTGLVWPRIGTIGEIL
jgi:hypothetical protein